MGDLFKMPEWNLPRGQSDGFWNKVIWEKGKDSRADSARIHGRTGVTVICIERKIRRIERASKLDFHPVIQERLRSAYKELESLHEIGKRMPWSFRNSLPIEIRESIDKLDDITEPELSKVGTHLTFDFDALEKHVISLTKALKKVENDDGLYYSWPEEEEEDGGGGGVISSKMVGLSDKYIELIHKIKFHKPTKIVVSVVGMPGIGKTILVKKFFEDPKTIRHFDCRVWLTVGRKCEVKGIHRRILAKLERYSDGLVAKLEYLDDEGVGWYLNDILKGKRYLIVLDDVWDRYIVYRHNKLRSPFPDEQNGSRLLITSRLQQVDKYNNQIPNKRVLTMRLLNKEESWDLLVEKVFGEETWPSRLEKAGKKIAEHCDGLPLTITVVANFLSKVDKSLQYWSEVAGRKTHRLFMDAYDEISEVLLPSYRYLPRVLQMCFLYMGAFLQTCETRRSKIINMWYVDGFFETNIHEFSISLATECLEELVSNNLVMIYQSSTDPTSHWGDEQIKTCGLHSSLWHLSKREAGRTKFCQVLNNNGDGLGEGMKNQRRLSFHNNILLSLKDVYKSVEDNCTSTARSLLCYGPYHQYQVPICFGLKLLRELDAVTIHFYKFPLEILQLVQLRYLALTLNGSLPASICRLSKLKFLIIDQHMSIKSWRVSSYMPVEIWKMKELEHLQVTGSDLPYPFVANSLGSLVTLSNVSPSSCLKGTLKAIPNLKKLGIQIELVPEAKPLISFFDHISLLHKLESLKCVIKNPEFVPPLAPLSVFPSMVSKLSLSGLGYPWKEMSKITPLQYLRVLKLRNYAFRGPIWDVEEGGFTQLCCLVIEDTDLVEWKIGCFQRLKTLSMKHCYKLVKVDGNFGKEIGKIEVIDCNPLAIEQVKMATRHPSKVCGRSSWVDEGSNHDLQPLQSLPLLRTKKGRIKVQTSCGIKYLPLTKFNANK